MVCIFLSGPIICPAHLVAEGHAGRRIAFDCLSVRSLESTILSFFIMPNPHFHGLKHLVEMTWPGTHFRVFEVLKWRRGPSSPCEVGKVLLFHGHVKHLVLLDNL